MKAASKKAELKLSAINLNAKSIEAKESAEKKNLKEFSIYNWNSEDAKMSKKDSSYRESQRCKMANFLMKFNKNEDNPELSLFFAKSFLRNYTKNYSNQNFKWESISNKNNLKNLQKMDGEKILIDLQKFLIANKLI